MHFTNIYCTFCPQFLERKYATLSIFSFYFCLWRRYISFWKLSFEYHGNHILPVKSVLWDAQLKTFENATQEDHTRDLKGYACTWKWENSSVLVQMKCQESGGETGFNQSSNICHCSEQPEFFLNFFFLAIFSPLSHSLVFAPHLVLCIEVRKDKGRNNKILAKR